MYLFFLHPRYLLLICKANYFSQANCFPLFHAFMKPRTQSIQSCSTQKPATVHHYGVDEKAMFVSVPLVISSLSLQPSVSLLVHTLFLYFSPPVSHQVRVSISAVHCSNRSINLESPLRCSCWTHSTTPPIDGKNSIEDSGPSCAAFYR